MKQATSFVLSGPGSSPKDVIDELLCEGAQRMLSTAIEVEVADYIEKHKHLRDEEGHRQVVRNGRHRPRKIATGVGEIEVRQPRVHSRAVDEDGDPIKFASKVLPPYLRRTKRIEELIPWLYLREISTNDFSERLQKLTGSDAVSLSATTVVRLKEVWSKEYQVWSQRSLAGKRYVYLWADGVYFNIRLEEDRQCILVIVGATCTRQRPIRIESRLWWRYSGTSLSPPRWSPPPIHASCVVGAGSGSAPRRS